MTAGKAATVIRLLSQRSDRDPRFVAYVVSQVRRGLAA